MPRYSSPHCDVPDCIAPAVIRWYDNQGVGVYLQLCEAHTEDAFGIFLSHKRIKANIQSQCLNCGKWFDRPVHVNRTDFIHTRRCCSRECFTTYRRAKADAKVCACGGRHYAYGKCRRCYGRALTRAGSGIDLSLGHSN